MNNSTRESLVDLKASVEIAYKRVATELPGLSIEHRQRAVAALDQLNSIARHLDQMLTPPPKTPAGNLSSASSASWDPSW